MDACILLCHSSVYKCVCVCSLFTQRQPPSCTNLTFLLFILNVLGLGLRWKCQSVQFLGRNFECTILDANTLRCCFESAIDAHWGRWWKMMRYDKYETNWLSFPQLDWWRVLFKFISLNIRLQYYTVFFRGRCRRTQFFCFFFSFFIYKLVYLSVLHTCTLGSSNKNSIFSSSEC